MEQQNTSNVFVNPESEAGVVNLLSVMFDSIAYMEASTVRYNIERASTGGMPLDDRTMRVELGNYVINHFSVIYFGLIANDVFREALKEAVTVEIALDEKDEQFIAEIRQNMKREQKMQKPSKGNYVIDLSKYNDDFYRKFNDKLKASFEKTASFDEAIDDMANDLDNEAKVDIGFIASNFMYLFRALTKNELFAHYVKTVVHSVEVQLGISQ